MSKVGEGVVIGKAWPIAVLLGGLMLTLAWGNSQRLEAHALRAELDRTQSRAERAERQMDEMSARIADLADESHTLNVVHKAVDFAPLPRAEETPSPEPSPRPQPQPVAAPPAAPALLSLNSIPPSACLLDGKPVGSTPQLHVPVLAGRHTVQFVTPEASQTVSVTVAAGESKPVTARLGAVAQPTASRDDGF